ncbi:MAG TPA: cobyric acid synthase [Nitrospira sp.]|nr:cobyric acid synthase [Nitrospira sp.]
MAARRLMVQGTASHVGKSVLTAGLCRLYCRRGVRVAPFKAQNMSNNSFVTPDGKEIGRAQAVQAAACRVAPRADFNPILIKPGGETSAQLVVDGEVAGILRAEDFGLVRRNHWGNVQRAFSRLNDDFDMIVLEGAGSPAEVNLRKCDVVNMAMARHADARVLLVADIDRGGAFASLVGTWTLLDEADRRLLKAFVINKFRGDSSLLADGIDRVVRDTGVPCAGVLPFWNDLGLPEEDSCGWREHGLRRSDGSDRIVIGIVDVPAMSNATDFEPLADEPDVELVPLAQTTDRRLDALLFPGSKQTVQALGFVRSNGFDRLAHRVLSDGGTVGGICAGYQLLGRVINDPDHVESDKEKVSGLGLLPVETVFATKKVVRAVSGCHVESGLPLSGYQVRMGRTSVNDKARAFVEIYSNNCSEVMDDGTSCLDGRVFGTYLHGLFDSGPFRRWWLNGLRAARGWSPMSETRSLSLDARLDRWADFVEKHVSMAVVDRLVDGYD